MSIKVSYSTMGQASPATVADDAGRTGGYRYRKDPTRTPDCPEYIPLAERDPSTTDEDGDLHPANAKAMASRKERVARYCELRDEGIPKAEAAAEVQVGRTAAKVYEGEYQARKEARND